MTTANRSSVPVRRCNAKNLQQVVSCVEPSVLRVEAHLSDGSEVQGTSFVVRVDSSGTYLLTNRHVIDGAAAFAIQVIAPNGKTRYSVKAVLANDAKPGTAGDLAILKIAHTSLRPLAFGNSATLMVGQTVASIGYGLAFQLQGAPSVTEGIVSARGRDLNDGFGPVWIQHQSTINNGNSGGPLLDLSGNVVGVNTLSIDQVAGGNGAAQGVFFAIPASIAQSVARKLIGQLQGSSVNLLRASAPSSSQLRGAYFTVSLPRGWIASRLRRDQPVAISRDQLVQMQLSTLSARGHLSTARLRQMLDQLAKSYGKIKKITVAPETVGRLHGLVDTVMLVRKPYHLTLVALPSGGRIFVLATIVRSGATPADMRQYTTVLRSVQPNPPARHHTRRKHR